MFGGIYLDTSIGKNHSDWQCAMCGVSLTQAVEKQFSVLILDVDILIDDDLLSDKKNQYIWERTQKHPKVTCSWDCGQNYKAWRRTGEPKSSYFATHLNCDCCGSSTTRGRIIKQRQGKTHRDFHLCIKCHRRKLIREGRRLWEILHKDYRLAYQRQWQKDHPKKMKMYKQHYRTRLAKKQARLGKTRKIICEQHPSMFI